VGGCHVRAVPWQLSRPKSTPHPPLDRIAVSWAERAREHYRGGRVDEACAAAKLAVAAWRRFGPKTKTKGRKPAGDDESVHMPKEVAQCAKLIERFEKRDSQE